MIDRVPRGVGVSFDCRMERDVRIEAISQADARQKTMESPPEVKIEG